MYKLRVLFKKEALLFFNDKVGLALMFLMPILLVFIITIIQNNAFNMISGKQLKLLVVNHDKGEKGNRLIKQVDKTAMFDICLDSKLTYQALKEKVSNKDVLVGLYIPQDFSEKLQKKTDLVSSSVLSSMGMTVDSLKPTKALLSPQMFFVHDPTLQESYCFSILNVFKGQAKGLEMEEMVKGIYSKMGLTEAPKEITEGFKEEGIKIERVAALREKAELPNASQHNVPAWTVFAMFFMVVSLGTNIVAERNSGSFVRIKTMPTNFSTVIFAKQIVYFLIAILQVVIIFGIGFWVFPHIGLPKLYFPDNILGMIVITSLCCLSAVSYAVMVGSIMRTTDQANGFGAISIIIFATFGGVWVPLFVLPEFMQKISVISPLHWCIEGFYVLFLKDENWMDILKIGTYIFSFSFICQTIAYLKLKK